MYPARVLVLTSYHARRVRALVAAKARVFKVTNKGTANFFDASGNILFHWNPRASEKPPVVVRNSKISGKWGTEQRNGSWPFTGLSNTDVLIRTGKSGFEITIGGKRMPAFDFKYKSSAAVSRIEGATESATRQLMKRSGSSACSSYDSAAVGKGDFGKMNCNWKRHYSQRQVSVSDLPVSLSLRCDSNDNIHAGFDSVKSRTSAYQMPWGNIECQNGKVILDWIGTRKTHTLKKNSDVVKIELGKDRQTKFYINDKHVQTGKTAIPASKFPVDWEFSSADASGYMRGVQWLGQQKGTRACLHCCHTVFRE